MDIIALIFGKIINFNMPYIRLRDIIDICIVTVVFYKITSLIKGTRTWDLFKGIAVVLVIAVAASFFQLHAVSWIISKTITVGMIAIIIIFQPELRRALEQIGTKNVFTGKLIDGIEGKYEAFTKEEASTIVDACFYMGNLNTGALIVFENQSKLQDICNTGIAIEALISKQLLINIFEKNTPLHDGAVVISNKKIVAASCFLPLSDDYSISRDLGTRHRAAIGITECTDAFVIVVSEETGQVSYVEKGIIFRDLSKKDLMNLLYLEQVDEDNERVNLISLIKRRFKK